jgi:hypothetical protein
MLPLTKQEQQVLTLVILLLLTGLAVKTVRTGHSSPVPGGSTRTLEHAAH